MIFKRNFLFMVEFIHKKEVAVKTCNLLLTKKTLMKVQI